jgi:hypothetical protein
MSKQCYICNKILNRADCVYILSGPIELSDDSGNYGILGLFEKERIIHAGCLNEIDLRGTIDKYIDEKLEYLDSCLIPLGLRVSRSTLYKFIQDNIDLKEEDLITKWLRSN